MFDSYLLFSPDSSILDRLLPLSKASFGHSLTICTPRTVWLNNILMELRNVALSPLDSTMIHHTVTTVIDAGLSEYFNNLG
jgi:hypothetical protein